jgi:hypothetical protein
MPDNPDLNAEALDSQGDPLGAPLSDPHAVVDHLTAASIAHNIHYAVPDPDPNLAAGKARQLADHLTPTNATAGAREGLRLWVELHHAGDRDLARRAAAALARLSED